MPQRSVTLHNNVGHLGHNQRINNFKSKSGNIDPSLSHNNETVIEFCGGDLKKVYHTIFDDSQKEYNQRQKDKRRKIDDYYKKIVGEYKKNKKDRIQNTKKPFYEIWLQVGNRETTGITDCETEREILRQYALDFQKRNEPNLIVIGAYIHADEPNGTLHMHLDYIPVSYENKRGMKTQNSLSGALSELGFEKVKSYKNNIEQQFTDNERKRLKDITQQHGIEVIENASDGHSHMTTQAYIYHKKKLKEKQEQIEQQNGEIIRRENIINEQAEVIKKQENEIKAKIDEVNRTSAEANAWAERRIREEEQKVKQAQEWAQREADRRVNERLKQADIQIQKIDKAVQERNNILLSLNNLTRELKSARLIDETSLENIGIKKNKKGKYEVDYNSLRDLLNIQENTIKTKEALKEITEQCNRVSASYVDKEKIDLKNNQERLIRIIQEKENIISFGNRKNAELNRAFKKLCQDTAKEPYNFMDYYNHYLAEARKELNINLDRGDERSR